MPQHVAALLAWAQQLARSLLEPHRPRVVTESGPVRPGESVRVMKDVELQLPPAAKSQGRDILVFCDEACTVVAPGGSDIIGADDIVMSRTSTWRFESDGTDWMVRA